MTDHARFRELAAGSVDGILTPDEERAFELHLRTCQACRTEVHAFAHDRDALSAIPPTRVSPTLQAIIGSSGRRRPSLRWPLLATAILVGSVGAALALSAGGRLSLTEPTPAPIVSLAPSAITAGTVRFRDGGVVAAAQPPSSLMLADMDGDRDLDLVIGIHGVPDEVVVIVGDGRGAFGGPLATAIEGAPTHRVADLDGDGRMDVLGSVRTADAIAVLYGAGRATFEPAVRLGVGGSPVEIEAVDVDADHRIDLVTANASTDDLSVIRSLGERTFAPAMSVPSGDGPSVLVPGDFDLDGHLDLVVGLRGTPGVVVHWGQGDGTFTGPRPVTTDVVPVDMLAADFDADGSLDLAVSNADRGSLTVLHSRPSGPFWTTTTLPAPHPSIDRPGDIESADVDGDGHLDLIAANGVHDEVLVWLGDGAGGFGAAQVVPVAGGPRWLEVGDVDGDGRTDLAATGTDVAGVSILLGE